MIERKKGNIMKTELSSIEPLSFISGKVRNASHKLLNRLPFLKRNALPHFMRTNIFRIEGSVKTSGSNLVTMFIGEKTAAYYFAFLVYSGKPEVKKVDNVPCTKIFAYPFTVSVDIVFIQTERMFMEKLKNTGFTVMPKVNFVLDLSLVLDEIIKKMSRRRRRDIAKMEKYGYSYELAETGEALDFFYSKMYVPYIQTRHHEGAAVDSLHNLKKLFRKGGILFVKRGGEYVAGILYHITGKIVHAHCLGIYDGAEQYLKEHAGQASLYFLILWAKNQGFLELDYGPTRPFLSDGTFMYKKEWGMKIRDQPNQSIYALKLCNFKKATRDFLLNNPFIFIDEITMNGLMVMDKTLPPTELTRICRTSCIPEIQSFFVLTYSKGMLENYEEVLQNLPASVRFNAEQIMKEGFSLQVHSFTLDDIYGKA